MLTSITRNRTYTLAALLFAAAFVICGIAWMRFFAAAATNPSPVRYMAFEGDRGTRDPFYQTCAGPAFIETDTVWRFCQYEPALAVSGGETWGLVRFDLAHGKEELHWPLPESSTSQILALAKAPDGLLAVVWGSPALSALYHINPQGGVTAISVPPDPLARVTGLAWTDRALELVTGDDRQARLHQYAGEAWQDARAIPAPDACAPDMLCAYQFAHWSLESGWQFLYAAAPVQITDPAAVDVRFLLSDDTGASALVDTVPLSDLASDQYTLDDGRLIRLGDLFDHAPGGVINWSLNATPFMLHDGVWKRVTVPITSEETSFYFSNYQITDSGLRWIPGLRYPQRGWRVDSWLTLRSSGEGIALVEIDGETGDTLTADTSFLQGDLTQATLLPASDGGYWVLGPNGAYLKVNPSLDRADGLSLPERISRAFEKFGRLDRVSDDFYREQRALKMAAFPLLLLSLPAGYLMVFFVRQSNKNRRAWIILLAQVSALYLILATAFVWWFWEITNDF